MKFFCSSLDIRDNLKVAFFGKNLTSIISKENCATFMSGNQYDRLSQQSFLSTSLLHFVNNQPIIQFEKFVLCSYT